MKRVLLFFLLILTFSLPVSAQDEVQSLSTLGGELRIVDRDTSFFVTLNGRVIYTQEWDTFKSLLAPGYNFGKTDLVLLSISGGGSSSGSFYKVIAVKKDGSASVSPSEFIGTGALPKITRRENALVIYFRTASTVPEGRLPAQTWIWQGGKLRKTGTSKT